ncbi:hypothetical protein SAMN05444401_2954 [Clostridium amylolyticum]|uniref:Uncharacterized protein n=1 Tax=Clostridium amylolyticum TaxID=1121298 RepID=A0A1M6J5F6_9CLOT|nr:hypothetical protein [Clostridium amylolyticum]SHJ41882.1 hypothetical protein SAMN05444401_2954 [Clostridium amylolyticum]
MNFRNAFDVLSSFDIKINLEEEFLREDNGYYQDYKVVLKRRDYFVYGIFKFEREETPHFEEKKRFEDERSASKYFLIEILSKHFFLYDFQKFISDQREIKIGTQEFDIKNLYIVLSIRGIPSSYFVEGENIESNGYIINLLSDSNGRFKVRFLNRKNVIYETISMSKQNAMFFSLKMIYLLDIFQEKVMPVLKRLSLIDFFQDADIASFIL